MAPGASEDDSVKREISPPVMIVVIAFAAVAALAFGYFVMRPTQKAPDVNRMMENMGKPKPSQPFVPKYGGP
jgi:hypothetical protein